MSAEFAIALLGASWLCLKVWVMTGDDESR